MNQIAGSVANAYRMLLRLYPIPFQQEYGEEMVAVFYQACQDFNGKSKWSVVQLGLHEIWDLPGNLARAYLSEIGRKDMHQPSKPGELITKSILRGFLAYGVGFGLLLFVYCLVDALFNSGSIFLQGNSLWNSLGLYPTGLAFGLGAALLGLHVGRRKTWLTVLAVTFAYSLFQKVWSVAYNAFLITANLEHGYEFLVPIVFETLLGLILGGLIGWIQQGWKKAGWFAIAGVIGFNLGWVVEAAVESTLIRESPFFGIHDLVVGNLWYFLILIVPLIFFGGTVGIFMGITTAGVNSRRLSAEHG